MESEAVVEAVTEPASDAEAGEQLLAVPQILPLVLSKHFLDSEPNKSKVNYIIY